MRKDVKIGLGIGGVLLAVLIVYLLVPKNNENGIDVVQNGGGESVRTSGEGADGTGSSGVANSGTGTTSEQASGTVSGSSTGTATGTGTGSSNEVTRETTAQGEGRTGQDTATADAGAERDGPPPPKVDWDTVFATGHIPEDYRVGLIVQNPQPQNSQPQNTQSQPDIFADRPGSEPDWSGVRSGTAPSGTSATSGTRSPTTPASQPPAANANSKGATREHVIQQGENLSMIAAVFYGDGRHYREILKANPTLDERRLKPGTVIKLPDASTFTAAKAQQAAARQEASLDATKEYRVQSGDNLNKIALKLYGKATKADALYEHNKDKIGDDPARLKLGMVLKLPEAPTVAQPAR